MAWTSPKTWSSEPLTSSDLNTYVRDNQEHLKDRLDNSASKAATGKTALSVSSATFVDVDSARLSLDLTTHGGDALIGFTGTVKCSFIGGAVYFNLSVDGVDYFAGNGIALSVASDTAELSYFKPVSFVALVTELDAGAHTFRLRWKTHQSNTATMNVASLHPQFWAKEL